MTRFSWAVARNDQVQEALPDGRWQFQLSQVTI
jgi:hypothetical protein